MARLIDADALCMVTDGNHDYYERFEIDNAPTVDPVKHGRWIIRDNPRTEWYRITCSECGEDVTSSASCIGFLPDARVLWDYCPYCGAKMYEVEDENT